MKTIYYTLSGDAIVEREMEDKEAEKHLDIVATKQVRSVRWTEKCEDFEDYKTETIEYVIPIEHISLVRVMDSNKEEKDTGDDQWAY